MLLFKLINLIIKVEIILGYIYKITNLINQKSYIGKTEKENPNQRWIEHQKDAKKNRNEKRPLYSALNKYGCENFSFEIIEQTNDLINREIYWINLYQTYGKGYNATLGGDGRSYLDVDNILRLYQQGYNCREISEIINHSAEQISTILHQNGIQIRKGQNQGIKTAMYNISGELLQVFKDRTIAAQYCIDNHLTNCKLSTARTHICEVCLGKRKTFAKLLWKNSE